MRMLGTSEKDRDMETDPARQHHGKFNFSEVFVLGAKYTSYIQLWADLIREEIALLLAEGKLLKLMFSYMSSKLGGNRIIGKRSICGSIYAEKEELLDSVLQIDLFKSIRFLVNDSGSDSSVWHDCF